MTAKMQKQQPTIKLNLTPGPVSPAMHRAWVTFWKRIITEAKGEVKKNG